MNFLKAFTWNIKFLININSSSSDVKLCHSVTKFDILSEITQEFIISPSFFKLHQFLQIKKSLLLKVSNCFEIKRKKTINKHCFPPTYFYFLLSFFYLINNFLFLSRNKHSLCDFSSIKFAKEAFHAGLCRKQIKLRFSSNVKIAWYWNINQNKWNNYKPIKNPVRHGSRQLQVSKTSERKFSSRNMCTTFSVTNETPRRKTFSMSSIIS